MTGRDRSAEISPEEAARYVVTWSRRAARYGKLGRIEEQARAAIVASEWRTVAERFHAVCPMCGQREALAMPEDGDDMDGAGARCGPCWDATWAHGKAHVPEAWLIGDGWPVWGSDGRWYAFGDGCEGSGADSWATYAGALEGLTIPDPKLRPWRSVR